MQRAMAKAGAGVPSANRISLLRDADGDGIAETKTACMAGLMSPFGMALVGDMLYIANADEIVRVPYVAGETSNTAKPESFFVLPGGPINRHWTKNIAASADGRKLYAAVGSNSNVGENGLDAETGRAAIWEIDLATAKGRLFATGLRNPVGMDFSADGHTLHGGQRTRRARRQSRAGLSRRSKTASMAGLTPIAAKTSTPASNRPTQRWSLAL